MHMNVSEEGQKAHCRGVLVVALEQAVAALFFVAPGRCGMRARA